MKTQIPRRLFLKRACGAGAASLSLSGRGAARASANSNEPQAAASSSHPRLFVGCCAYSFRKYLQAGRMTMEDFIRKGVAMGVHGVDMSAYWLKSTQPAYLASLRHLAFHNGMPFSGAACGVQMVEANADKRKLALEEIKQWIDATDRLGASHLRVFAGKLPQGATVDQAVGWVVETFKPAADYAGEKGITLGVEDHEGITQRAETILEIIHRVHSPYAGINLDITHFTPSAAQDAYAQIEACIPYATHTHIRDHFDDGQPIDLDRVWRMFARGGYKGYMSAEYQGTEDAMTGVPKLIAKIKTLCRKYSSA